MLAWPTLAKKGKSVKFMNALNLKTATREGYRQTFSVPKVDSLLAAAPTRVMQSLKSAFRRKTQTAKSFRTAQCAKQSQSRETERASEKE